MSKRRGLGRGLDALLGGSGVSIEDQIEKRSEEDGSLRKLPIEQLQRGKFQPRRDMHPEGLEDLANSIRSQGVMQPIVVRMIGDDKYEIIAGERRWRAAQMAGLDVIPALLRDVPDEAAVAMALIENIQREDLNPIEEAVALNRLQTEFELTQLQVAEAVGKSRATVANLMRLLSLEADVRVLLEHGDIEMGHARALLSLNGQQQIDAARTVAGKGLTVRQTEALAKKLQMKQETPVIKQPLSGDILSLQERVSENVGLPVKLAQSPSGKGKITFSYSRLEELEGLLEKLKVPYDYDEGNSGN